MAELREKLQTRLAATKAERLDNDQGLEYLAWNQAARDVMKIARREKELS
jgi:hypothetical protein